MRTRLTRVRTALVLLLVGSGLLFAIGSTIERHDRHAEQPATAVTASGESGESGESGGENGSGESTTAVERNHGERGAKLLGVNTESLTLTVVAVVVSVVLGVAVWLGRRQRLTLLCVAGFGLVFAVGDGRELVHQLDESNAGLAVIAAILIGLHLAISALAAALYPRQGAAGGVTVAAPTG